MLLRISPLIIALSLLGNQAVSSDFEHLVLNEAFFSEGASIVDIDGDGHMDIVSGPRWYQGPAFRHAIAYADGGPYAIKGYSAFFFTFPYDFDADGDQDILAIPIPGQPAHWYENPGDSTQAVWAKHMAFPYVGGESPAFQDITDDGRPELICIYQGAFGYAEPNPEEPEKPWAFTPISTNRNLGQFTHGMGVGDVDGDGRMDLLETEGWWQQTNTAGQRFQFHALRLAQSGGAQMFVYDFDGDGDNDILSTQNAHGWGLSWFERRGSGDDYLFVPHKILTNRPADHPDGLAISQMHAVALADIDGDGVKDIITGKRFWAHGGSDPGAHQMPVLYWFRTERDGGGNVSFKAHLIRDRVGVGTQLPVGDIDGDGRIDLVVGNKLGTHVLINRTGRRVPRHRGNQPLEAGNDAFAQQVRETEPLTPQQEQRSFRLPVGFQIQLVAAEPQIDKPMNLAFDHKGRLWVSSSREYPNPATGDNKGRDTIKILEDTNGDGRADVIKTFADGLNIPMGLYPCARGVICFSIPNIWYLEDTDGDDRCDRRHVLYGPMGYERDTHGMCNAFTRGLDGWLYACHGFNNHTTVSGRDGHSITMQSGNSFRMRLDGSRVEHFTHGQVNPFGMTIDPMGDLFTADCHTKPVTLLLRDGYYESFGKPHDGLGFVPNVMEHLHGSTAIGGIAIYNDAQFPPIYHGNAFGGNVMTSRINRNSIQRSGASIRAREEPDFLISSDPWFRPVDLQIGPDGAMYVADFYNRIIGHYEVPLDHPGRDRRRGRIWKISYNPNASQRRDVPEHNDALGPLKLETVDDAIVQLGSPSLSRRLLATDSIVDRFGTTAVGGLRKAFQSPTSPQQRIHAMWALWRLGGLENGELRIALTDPHEIVRVHAYRALSETTSPGIDTSGAIRSGLADRSPLVRRAAATAASQHQDASLMMPLVKALRQAPAADVHLRHVVRMALRDHLRNEVWFVEFTAGLPEPEAREIARICVALKTSEAADFLIAHIDQVAEKEADLLDAISMVARYVSLSRVEQFVNIVNDRFQTSPETQRELLDAVAEGFEQRGIDAPRPVRQWAGKIARGLIHADAAVSSIGWTATGNDAKDRSTWVSSTKRTSADGQKNSLLHSSFPNGEQRVGVLRSDDFELPSELSFYVAGHDAYPQDDLHGTNWVRLRDAASGKILHQVAPPRNDTAQRVIWEIDKTQFPRGYIELVDGNTDGAYAWLAVGRFSIAGLNPNNVRADREQAVAIIKRLGLVELRDTLIGILRDAESHRSDVVMMAEALAELQGSSSLRALASALKIGGLSNATIETIKQAMIQQAASDTGDVFLEVMKTASASQQLAIAQRLATDLAGATQLVQLIQQGHASARLLKQPTIAEPLETLLPEQQRIAVAKMLALIEDDDAALLGEIKKRVALFRSHPSSLKAGQKLFQQHCAACHKIGNEGHEVGPNLDGVGNRGIDRLTEDVLLPNRNVDVAFRASTILTDSGSVHTGLIKPGIGAQIILVDSKGKEISIAKDTIEQRRDTARSPMPANFSDTIKGQQFSDLLNYLLSLR